MPRTKILDDSLNPLDVQLDEFEKQKKEGRV